MDILPDILNKLQKEKLRKQLPRGSMLDLLDNYVLITIFITLLSSYSPLTIYLCNLPTNSPNLSIKNIKNMKLAG